MYDFEIGSEISVGLVLWVLMKFWLGVSCMGEPRFCGTDHLFSHIKAAGKCTKFVNSLCWILSTKVNIFSSSPP